jgi:DNA-binding CsgD family transcriptional regulator
VLRLVAEGQSNSQIGAALFISPKTVSVHITNVLAKLGVTNSARPLRSPIAPDCSSESS